MNDKKWLPLSEALKIQNLESIINDHKNEKLQAQGHFETDADENDWDSGISTLNENELVEFNIKIIPSDIWQKGYVYNPQNETITRNFSTRQGSSGWYSYSNIEISSIPLLEPIETVPSNPKESSRESELHREIGEAYQELQKTYPTKTISATMVWNYLKKIDLSKSCIISFAMDKVSGEGVIEWRSSYGTTGSLKRLSFNNIVSNYSTKKKTV